MVYLNRIYTRTGDDGSTALGDGTRVPKTAARIAAYGTVDELNSVLGIVRSLRADDEFEAWLEHIQNDLFDAGADLCVPLAADGADEQSRLRLTDQQAERLEGWIDRINERLEPLTSFVLPAGSSLAVHLHHARTVCRRAERDVCMLAADEPVNASVLVYLNRLSDLLFVMARAANDSGRADVLWIPGQNRDS